jgi:hypothetical protein
MIANQAGTDLANGPTFFRIFCFLHLHPPFFLKPFDKNLHPKKKLVNINVLTCRSC